MLILHLEQISMVSRSCTHLLAWDQAPRFQSKNLLKTTINVEKRYQKKKRKKKKKTAFVLAFRVHIHCTEFPISIFQLKAAQQHLNTGLIWGEGDNTACSSMPAKSIFYVYRFCLTTITLSQAVKSNIYKLMGYLLNFVSFLLFFY